MRKNKIIGISMAVLLTLSMAGCNSVKKQERETSGTTVRPVTENTDHTENKATPLAETKSPEETKAPVQTEAPKETKSPANQKKVVVIDAGHQLKQNSELEAVAPGSKEKKKKVSSGTEGHFTKVPEYEVTLSVSKQLKASLEKQGYQVIMTRETNNVNLSNQERAKIANDAKADVFIRIHCNGVDNASVNGALTLCPTKNSPYCKSIYEDSYALSKDVLSEMVKTTGAKDRGITKTDTMAGINWSKVPVTIVEMGYMSNKDEDEKLVSKDYQKLLVKGITKGIVKYLEDK